MNDNLFVGFYPEGVVYADRQHEVRGDYKRLAFLPYRTLELNLKEDCPDHLAAEIESHAAEIQMQRGLDLEITACGQSVRLGSALRVNTPYTVQEAAALLGKSVRDGETLIEATYPYRNSLNDRSRLLIQAYINEQGRAWLGRVNIYEGMEDRPIIWESTDAASVDNCGASFVLPAHDDELETLIVKRHRAPYVSAAHDGRLVSAIFDRLESAGGRPLFWN